MNPAIDRTIAVDRLAFDDRAYILSSNDSAGGRGINASCVIHNFGGKTLAILPAGGEPAVRFERFMDHCGFPVATVPIRNDIRLNLTITDRHGLTVKLNEAGPRLDWRKSPTSSPPWKHTSAPPPGSCCAAAFPRAFPPISTRN